MVAIIERPQQIVLSGITWGTFERILTETGDRHLRVTYDEGNLEFMTLSFEHENLGKWIARLIFFAALELQIPLSSGGSTTLKHGLRRKGLEPDECFWIQHEEAMRGKKRWRNRADPPPDLAVEIDITSSSLDRLGIYASLRVPEVWRYDGNTFKVLVLGANGKYRRQTKSRAFPTLPLESVSRFIARLGSKDEIHLIQDYIDWLREEVIGTSSS
jgi:Uma2 family endonuclease